MSAQLDSSGEVSLIANDGDLKAVIWSDLDPFTQGYVEALFDDATAYLRNFKAFSDLAPETLARIMGDCALRLSQRARLGSAKDGADFWTARQRGTWDVTFPPLTPYLGDDGKVYLRVQS